MYLKLLYWLDNCETAELTYFFTVVESECGFKKLYGFTNFEIKEFEDTKIYYYSLNDEAEFKNFFLSRKAEGNIYLLPANLYAYINNLKDIDLSMYI